MKSLRYRNAKSKSDLLGQIYTPELISDLLIDSLPIDNKKDIKQIVDLGAGGGALTQSAMCKFKSAKSLLVEIDKISAKNLSRKFAQDNKMSSVICVDALSKNWAAPNAISLLLSNPPYGAIQLTNSIQDYLNEADLDIPTNGGWVRGDSAFLAKAWCITKINNHFGLIISSTLIKSPNAFNFRKKFTNEMRNLCITKLDEKTFETAEVAAYLVTGQRSINRNRNVLLRKALANGTIVDELSIPSEAANFSLDIDYHRSLFRMGISARHTLETVDSLGVNISRGSKSQRDFERLGIDAFHTTDFPDHSNNVVLLGSRNQFKTASRGDILIPRVGSRCLTKQARVKAGVGSYTDCIYRLSGTRKSLSRVWQTLNSSFGAEWRLAYANGSCAKYLTNDTILSMPIKS